MPEPNADSEMTRPLSAREVASIVGELFGRLGVFVVLALVCMLGGIARELMLPAHVMTIPGMAMVDFGTCGPGTA